MPPIAARDASPSVERAQSHEMSAQPISGSTAYGNATLAAAESEQSSPKIEKRSLGYALRSGLAGGLAGCAVGCSEGLLVV